MPFFVFIFGLLFGSLANVILLRFNTGESLVYRGSRCFSCSRRLEWFELIPVFSFLLLRRRCRTCKSKISWQYPLVELGTGSLFLLIFISARFNISAVSSYLILNTLYLILVLGAWYFLWLSALYDFRHKILPDFFNYAGLSLALSAFWAAGIGSSGVSFMIHDSKFLIHGLTSAVLFFFFFSLWFLSRGRWMGLGDAKFVLAFGFLLNPIQALLAVLFAFWIGAVVGLSLIAIQKLARLNLTSKSINIKSELPFGPFLFLGGILSFTAGERIFNWYIQLF